MSVYGERIRQLFRAELRLEDHYSDENETFTGSPYSTTSVVVEVNGVSLTLTPQRRRGWLASFSTGMFGTPWFLVEFYAGDRFLIEERRSGDYPREEDYPWATM